MSKFKLSWREDITPENWDCRSGVGISAAIINQFECASYNKKYFQEELGTVLTQREADLLWQNHCENHYRSRREAAHYSVGMLFPVWHERNLKEPPFDPAEDQNEELPTPTSAPS